MFCNLKCSCLWGVGDNRKGVSIYCPKKRSKGCSCEFYSHFTFQLSKSLVLLIFFSSMFILTITWLMGKMVSYKK